MYLCEYAFNRADPNDPSYSLDEVDFYAWTPAKFHSQIPNHRLTLLKNLVTGEYEFHRVYMQTVIGKLRGLGIVVTQRKAGYTEVAYTTKSLQEAADWGNREWDKFHYELGGEHHDDKVCQHVYPHKYSFCHGPKYEEAEK
uniref:Uncharacterized protein n=1 Tax=viral metagenome TaxID=1070528 RepID=A0A6M3LZP6_9ZZZZ